MSVKICYIGPFSTFVSLKYSNPRDKEAIQAVTRVLRQDIEAARDDK